MCVPIPSHTQLTRPSIGSWLNSPSVPWGSGMYNCNIRKGKVYLFNASLVAKWMSHKHVQM